MYYDIALAVAVISVVGLAINEIIQSWRLSRKLNDLQNQARDIFHQQRKLREQASDLSEQLADLSNQARDIDR